MGTDKRRQHLLACVGILGLLVCGLLLCTTAIVGGFFLLDDASTPLAGGEDLGPGYRRVTPRQIAELTAADGTILAIPEWAYDQEVAVKLELLAESSLPQSTAVHQLVSPVYELDQEGYATQLKPLSLRIPYNPAELPEGVSAEALTVVWWNGETWLSVPSETDHETQEIVAPIHHFSQYAAAVDQFEELVADPGYFDGLADAFAPFAIHYTTQEEHRPDLTDGDANGAPDYIDQLGAQLTNTLADYNNDFGISFSGRGAIDVYVFDFGYDGGTVARGVIGFDNDEPPSGALVAHELFHFWQHAQISEEVASRHLWWSEATAVWMEDEVDASANAYFTDIEDSRMSLPQKGFSLTEFTKHEQYAAVTLAKFLEHRFPGFILATFDPQSGLRYDETWFTGFGRILADAYNEASLLGVLNEYFAWYYVHWDLYSEIEDMPSWFGTIQRKDLADPVIVADTGMYRRVTSMLPALSSRLIVVEDGSNLDKATLVVQQQTVNNGLLTYVFGRSVGNSDIAVDLGGDFRNGGYLLQTEAEQRWVLSRFGDPSAFTPVSQVHLLANNMNPADDVAIDLEVYVLEPPTNVSFEDPEADPVRISWEAPRLPIGRAPGDRGALKGFRLYRQVGSGAPEQVGSEIGPTETSIEVARDELGLDEEAVTLFMRAVDKYENQSEDSDRLGFELEATMTYVGNFIRKEECFQDSVSSMELCDVVIDITVSYTTSTLPATITCNAKEAIDTVELSEQSGSVQLSLVLREYNVTVDPEINFVFEACTMEPDGLTVSDIYPSAP